MLKRVTGLLVLGLVCLSTPKIAFSQTKISFAIAQKPLDKALIDFAQQANTTLLFPYDLAKKETANSLRGEYLVALGIVKLLEGTSLFPVENEDGTISIKPVVNNKNKSVQNKGRVFKTLNKIVLKVEEPELERIAVVGTRAAPRSIIDSPVPLDIISSEQFTRQGATDMMSMLSTLVPSFNVNDQPINDASSLVRPANLRGMSSDHTLVLMNGKRRHRSSVITFLGGGLSDGAQGPDISTIPVSALKQVEILRDGAAAQYGSDAIAGVLNFVLKEDDAGGILEARVGQYLAGDGEMLQLQANMGLSLSESGYLNLSAEYRQQNDTDRSVQRADAQSLIVAGNTQVASPAQIWGSPDLDYDQKFLINLGQPISDDSKFYSFANFAKRSVEGGFYYRHPHKRTGVYVQDDAGGQARVLVADLDGLNRGIECPEIAITDDNVLDDPAFLAISAGDAVGNNCFAFQELLPGGFRPVFGGELEDAAAYFGVTGEMANEWFYDISASYGVSKIQYFLNDSLNPSLGANSPTSFLPGSAEQRERNINLDLSRAWQADDGETVNIAAGFEWRRERYRQQAGDPASYAVGDLAFNPLTEEFQGFGVGSNGFPGYRPESAGEWSRGNIALYTDLEWNLNHYWLIGAALRYEDFTDFGNTLNGKLSTRIELSRNIALRAAYSTGFKAPTVGQSNVINVTTAFSQNGLEDQATLPPTNPISAQLGATPLQPEESTNISLGLVGSVQPNLYFTLDYFNIQLDDRISTTSALPINDDDIQVLLAQGVPDATSYSAVKFFTNDFDTQTQGVDLVLNYETDWWATQTKFTFAYNWTDTQVEEVTQYQRTAADGSTFTETNLTPQRIRMLEDNLPEHRFSLSMQQQLDRLGTLLRLNYMSGFYEDHLDAADGLDINAGSEVTLDFELGYALDSSWYIAAGAKNLFDNRPDLNPYRDLVGAKYPPTAPIGINGGFYYLRSSYQF